MDYPCSCFHENEWPGHINKIAWYLPVRGIDHHQNSFVSGSGAVFEFTSESWKGPMVNQIQSLNLPTFWRDVCERIGHAFWAPSVFAEPPLSSHSESRRHLGPEVLYGWSSDSLEKWRLWAGRSPHSSLLVPGQVSHWAQPTGQRRSTSQTVDF